MFYMVPTAIDPTTLRASLCLLFMGLRGFVWVEDLCFNPLPLPKQGEIELEVGDKVRIQGVSIRSPCRSKGRSARVLGHRAQH